MALSTKTLDALNDSRKTEPHKYIWGQFTPDKEGVGYSDLPEQTNIPDDANLVLDVNGPSLVKASVKDLKNGIGSLLHDDLATKVSKSGDTMTGELKMSGRNQIRFGTDDNYFYIKMIPDGTFVLYNKNGKGLFVQKEEAHAARKPIACLRRRTCKLLYKALYLSSLTVRILTDSHTL